MTVDQRRITADEAFAGMLAASKAFQGALDGFAAARNDQTESIEDLERISTLMVDIEKTELENKVEELSDALDTERMAHQAQTISFNYLWTWNARLEDQHEHETQELKEAGRQLADENMGLRAEFADMEKRYTALYSITVREMQDRHKDEPALLRSILRLLHDRFGDPVTAKESERE
ncbi:hypothetical protein P171DRAFT_488424 [Karstenula rhodostoma CBS 690.94]|uniref:Uncharacterized protein n=1 Tax=Karstenula rhodostoma CBS 690.94 TaxID=1392251 RepID=A0A9P4PD31_9PLEO|nr:hypothetical protein P171DRAFT_488424 [Karstenula rhodostoma CBS 690.94]